MSRTWQSLEQTRRVHELSFADGLQLLLQGEADERSNRRFDRLHKNARFRYQASVAELGYDAHRGMDKALISELTTCQWIEKGESLLICGPTGVGKSTLATALGTQACAMGFSVIYFNTQKLIAQTKNQRLEGTVLKFFDRIAKCRLLILDDFGLTRLQGQQQLDMLEIIEDRHGKASTIVASQLPVSSWYDVFGDETVADSLLDRLVHASYKIELKGESLRKKK
ncbi:MAG: IS21-like element helper ATPase IstB [Bacteroidales bacterium]|nr:IS21-like element helper ATPase IstB [Bacteroidales bacterium]